MKNGVSRSILRKLECSRCGHSGFAEASEKDEKGSTDVDFRIDELPRGFRASVHRQTQQNT